MAMETFTSDYEQREVIHVLHVDDCSPDSELLESGLSKSSHYHFDIQHRDSLDEALKTIGERDYDVVLLNYNLPDSSGIETFSAVFNAAANKPIVLLAEDDDDAIVSEALGQGAQACLSKKKIAPDVLENTILFSIQNKLSYETLKRQEERLELAVKGSDIGLWDWDIASDVVWLSGKWGAAAEFKNGECVKQYDAWLDGIHPNDKRAVSTAIKYHLQAKVPFRVECRIMHDEGKYRWSQILGQAVWGADKKAIRMSGSISDIHMRKQMEEDLISSEERFALAVKGASVGIWDWDITNDNLHLSEQLKRILGLQGEPFSQTVSFFEKQLHDDDRDRVVKKLNAHLRKKKSFDVEFKIKCGDGGFVWVHCKGQALWDDDGHPVRMAGSLADISERKQAEEREKKLELNLRQSQKLEAVGQLAAGIAHEINTPAQYIGDNVNYFKSALDDIKGIVDLYGRLLVEAKSGKEVSKGVISDVEEAAEEADLDYLMEDLPEAIDSALDGVSRISSIVKAMKEFSHPGTSKKEFTDINRCIKNTVVVSHSEWKYVAELQTELASDLPNVYCLQGEMNQVFLNMIVNAAHAIAGDTGGASEGAELGLIKISTVKNGDFCEIKITDNGQGMPPEVKERIFDPFYTTKEVGKGTGQGLAIAYSVVVDKHQGAISVDSEEGVGTTFTISVPIHFEGD